MSAPRLESVDPCAIGLRGTAPTHSGLAALELGDLKSKMSNVPLYGDHAPAPRCKGDLDLDRRGREGRWDEIVAASGWVV